MFIRVLLLFLMTVTLASAHEVIVKIHAVSAEGIGKEIGTITATQTPYGVLFTPQLSDLPPGLRGFHLHENPSCEPAKKDDKMTPAQAAGSHYDPKKVAKHEGPYGEGHMGDLAPLYVGPDGKATQPALSPRLKLKDLTGHALMIHAGGDNFSDKPEPLGGGGTRIACGVIKSD
jgi:Cu-Zn family superoxide dismutase